MKQKIRAGIIGAAGYTGGELIRLLIQHPTVELVFAQSKSHAGQAVYKAHSDLLGDTELLFSSDYHHAVDVLFLCMGHGESKKFMETANLPDRIKVIDLSQDFRLKENSDQALHAMHSTSTWVYGLPELNKDLIATAQYVANPGCFATAIQLALLPLAKEKLITDDIHISAVTGSTGAGQALSASAHFSWRSNNVSSYKVFSHQHLAEISQSMLQLQQNFQNELHFVPYRGSFTRGIFSTVYTRSLSPIEETLTLYHSYYEHHPFVWLSQTPVDVKQVSNSNKCFLHLEKKGHQLIITSILDNLIKGASGQALQNMNLMFGLPETAGLRLKTSAF